MHDLNLALKQWKRSFRGKCSAEDLAELESHLLEHMDDLRDRGLSGEEAFARATSQMGSPGDVGREFSKVRSLGDWVLDRFRAVDLPLFLALVLVCGMGLSVICRYSMDWEIGALFWARQAVWIGLGFTLMFLIAQVKPAQLRCCAPFIYGASILLLALVPFLGVQVGGTRTRLSLGGLNMQPSVLVLLSVPMMTAWLLTKREWAATRKGFAVIISLILLPATLIMCQPDSGMALLCLGSGWITLSFSNCRARLVKFTCVALPVLCAAVWFLMPPFVLQHIMDSESHMMVSEPTTSGAFSGRGCTDYILSVVIRDFGITAVMAMLVALGFLLYRAIGIGRRSRDLFSRCLGLGFAGVVLMQLGLNVGGIYGWMPTLGVPLPLVSYGGSSMVLLLVGFGILSSIQRQHQRWHVAGFDDMKMRRSPVGAAEHNEPG